MERRRLGIIFLIVFLDLLAFGIIIPQLGVFAKLYQASGTMQGLLVASYSMMQFFCAPLLGRWSDRIGRKPVLVVALLTSFTGHILFALARSLPVLFAARIVDGLGGANISTAQAYISDITEPGKRARAMGLIGAAFGIGFVLGPVIGGLSGHWGVQHWGPHGGSLAIGGVAALCSSSTLLLTAFILPESHPPGARPESPGPLRLIDLGTLRTAFAAPVLARLLAIFLVSGSGFAVLHAVLPYLVVDTAGLEVHRVQDMAAAQVAIAKVFGWIGMLAVLIQGGAIGPLTKRWGEARLLLVGLSLMIVGLIALPLSGSLAQILLLITPLAAGNALATVTLPVLITFYSPPERRGEVLGLSQSLGSVGRIVGPVGGGILYDLGRATPFWVGACLCAIALTLAVAVPRERPEEPPEAALEAG